jgi:hypothetical protein
MSAERSEGSPTSSRPSAQVPQVLFHPDRLSQPFFASLWFHLKISALGFISSNHDPFISNLLIKGPSQCKSKAESP